jgi:hypothetical protein
VSLRCSVRFICDCGSVGPVLSRSFCIRLFAVLIHYAHPGRSVYLVIFFQVLGRFVDGSVHVVCEQFSYWVIVSQALRGVLGLMREPEVQFLFRVKWQGLS